jgi:hypothetical protein
METAAMLLSSSSSCLATIFVNGMGFVTPPPLRHLSPVPSHDGRQYRPHTHLWMVVGRRGAQADGGYQEVWRMGRGEIWVRRKGVFMQIRTILKQKKPKAKIAQCRGMGKFCPPAAALPESPRRNIYADDSCVIRGGGGRGGNRQNYQGSAPPLPKIVFLFSGFVFESAGRSLEKKKKK